MGGKEGRRLVILLYERGVRAYKRWTTGTRPRFRHQFYA
jgi:hypothetical protein